MHFWSKSNHNSLSGKRILVTGAAGFIGSHLVRELLDNGCQVAVLVKQSSDFWRIQNILDRIDVFCGDLSNLKIDELQPKLSDIQVIYHLGAAGIDQSQGNILSIMQTNIMGTLSMLQLAHNLRVERFIYCGSCSEYGSGVSLSEDALPVPITEYGVSKLSAWMLVNMFFRKYNLPVVSLRPFTVYGPFEARYRLIPHTIINALDSVDIELTGGKQTRDFIFIDDVVAAFLKAAVTPGIIGDTFNLSTGIAQSVKEVVSIIIKLTGSNTRPLFGVRPYRKSELWSSSGDPSKARNKLNWRAQVSLKEGLDRSIRWFKENRSKYSVSISK